MKIRTAIFAISIAILSVAGCISSTTTSTSNFEESGDAALQYYQLGARYYHRGSYELARERLKIALDLDPKMGNAHFTLALTYEQLENSRLAAEHYAEAVRVDPNNYDARNAYAVFLCRHEEFDAAVKQIDRALKIEQYDTRYVMLTNAGACMTRKPDYEKAEEYFREALKVRPTHGEALVQMAAMKFKMEDYLSARAFLQRYLSTNKSSPGVLFLAIQIEEALDDDRASTDYTNQLLREFPASPEARLAMSSE